MRRFVIFGVVIAAGVLLWSAGWIYISNEIRSQVALLGEGDGQTTPRLTCGSLDLGGYPFRFNLTCADATIVSADTTVTVPAIEAAALVFQPTLFHLRAVGPATVRDAYLGGQSRIDWASLEGSLRLADWRLGRLSIVSASPAWSDTLMTETLIGSARAAELHLTDIPGQHDPVAGLATLAGYLKLDGAAIPAWTVADGALTASVEVSNLPDDIRVLPAEPLREWQAAGGRVAIAEIKGNEGDDTITVSGDLGLSEAGLLEGTLEVVSKGVADRTAAFMAPELQPLIFGGTAEDGTQTQRLTITGGAVFVGMIPVFGIAPFF